ncbi:cytochrome P450 [Ganoderma sinense ZZ0214-1]|uniref:Cytochrome P450 n=1 Tax=Ganoderma sinense ZZ0214-1 TaxID=1077348 RepID=A0A2G8RPP5_9APHY|nr:cytochrome P450 [Ganoderma sinense ZZ0214-1]
MWTPSTLLVVLVAPAAITLYFLWTFLMLILRQARSPLRHLPGPPSPSFFMGNLREMHDQENNGLVARWTAQYGSTFVYRGFVGGCRLMTVDPLAVNHIMSRGYEYPKPDFVRDALASMAAGYEGLLTAEGEMHRKQNPAFSAAQIRSLTPIFWEKAVRLRDIWLDITASPKAFFTPVDPFALAENPSAPGDADPEPAIAAATSPSAATTSFLPNPFASFVPSKSSPTIPTLRSRQPHSNSPQFKLQEPEASGPCRLDVLPWLARAALDVIGEAGFGYPFHSLEAAAERRDEESELARAFGVIFSTARKFRVMTILQVWFPVLRRFTVFDRDLLSVLVRSNISEVQGQRMSLNELLCQISTFLAAGHETSSSALTWTLYALARCPSAQTKLREELRSVPVPTPSSISPSPTSSPPMSALFDRITHLPYLDAVVRESLRLYAPITTTMRVATSDDAIPVAAPFVDRRGRTCTEIRVRKGDIISVPIQAMNKGRDAWGEDADVFRPERWEEKEGSGRGKHVQGLWGSMLTFGGGNPVNGNRSCIGYRFALSDVVTRPCVKSEPHRGNQMPLYIRRVPSCPRNSSLDPDTLTPRSCESHT